MRLITLAATDGDGGAAHSTYRLHCALRQIGVDARMLTLRRAHDDSSIEQPEGTFGWAVRALHWRFDSLPLKLYPERDKRYFWSVNWIPFPLYPWIHSHPADLYHVHWVGGGYLPIHLLGKLDKPTVWTLKDSWAFTGGCHIPLDCTRYTGRCGACPQLHSSHEHDLSRLIWWRKQRAYRHMSLTVVTPSHWLADCARASNLLGEFRIEVIPNGIDTSIFHPTDQRLVRTELGLSPDKKYVAFGAMSATSDRVKGFHLLQPALQQLSAEWKDRLELLIFGASTPDDPPDFGLPTHYLGTIRDDDKLAQVYAAADAFIIPSLSENFPNTVLEALACGTPCVGFHIGGIPDLIEHQQNGYLAEPYEAEDLARGIAWVLEDDQRYAQLSARARQKVEEEFEIQAIARKHRDLYAEILDAHPKQAAASEKSRPR